MDALKPLTKAERQRLRELRANLGWSYDDMAERIGVKVGALRYILQKPESQPHDTNLYRVRQFLQTNEIDLNAVRGAR